MSKGLFVSFGLRKTSGLMGRDGGVGISFDVVILIPAAYLLSLTGRLEAVWFSFPLAEIASLLVTLLYLKKTMRNLDEMIAHRT